MIKSIQLLRTVVGLSGCFRRAVMLLAGIFGLYSGGLSAGDDNVYSPPVRENITHLYWGDTHLHTTISADAYSLGTRLTPEQSYRYAQGETVKVDNGMEVKLDRPLDFLAISDHAEYMGVFSLLAEGSQSIDNWPMGKRWARYIKEGNRTKLVAEFSNVIQSTEPSNRTPESVASTVWENSALNADRFNIPGHFTAFVAYEWTSIMSGDNLHRVVLFRDSGEKAKNILPFSAQHSKEPEDLWTALEGYHKDHDLSTFAIPHNANGSNGRMFSPTRNDGSDFDSAYVAKRAKWEPLVEVTQVKGDGEAHPYLSPADQFADFETWDRENLGGTTPKEDWMLQYEYARSALKEGLKHKVSFGSNPFKFGMIGSTDSHTGVSTPSENNFFGKFVESEPSPDRHMSNMAHLADKNWSLSASGLAAVWAEENTRESIFDAMKRREVYATTGPRIMVRFFGGWDFEQKDLVQPDYASRAYQKGVPMGGDLTRASASDSPSFLIVAAKDPNGANLDRIQVVKGWMNADGKTHERIFDVALSDDRSADINNGKTPDVGNTVDVKNATYTNSIGDSELYVVWQDPEFNPDQHAFYYVRVLEIPKPRWTAYDAKYFGVDMPDEIPMVVQDRAYTSPIWYTP